MTTTTGAKPHPIFLAGTWVESDDPLIVANPADPANPAGATFHATEAQYEEAVEAAVKAFEVTRTLPAYERGAILRNISSGIRARREEIGRLLSLEAGKPIRDALVEVDRAVVTFRLGAEEAERMVGETIPLDISVAGKGRMGITRRFPIGPIAGISPFNFPLNLAAHKVAPAIATGNPIVLKPPSKDPLTMLTVAEIIEEAGAPAGSVSILPMSRELGDRMVSDDRFKLLTFTGSPSVGWRMKERAGKKKVVLELGGNAGVIIDKTADLDWAVKRCLVGAFAYAGQVCISVQRMFVHEDVWDAFMPRFVEGARALKVGDPLTIVAGVLREPLPVSLPPLPARASESMRRVSEGFRLLLSVEGAESAPFSRRFAAKWCGPGLGEMRAGRAIDRLRAADVLRVDRWEPLYGRANRTPFFKLGEGAR